MASHGTWENCRETVSAQCEYFRLLGKMVAALMAIGYQQSPSGDKLAILNFNN